MTITAKKVDEANRLEALPKHFGHAFAAFETTMYSLAESFCDEYSGGLWVMVELSNGGFYMYPESPELVNYTNAANYSEGTMRAESFGIALTLFACSQLSFSFDGKPGGRRLAANYHLVREYAFGDYASANEAEGVEIYRLCD